MSLRCGRPLGRTTRGAIRTAWGAPAGTRLGGHVGRHPAARALRAARRAGCVQGRRPPRGGKTCFGTLPACGSPRGFEAWPAARPERQDLHNPPPLECLPGRSTEGGKSWWCGTRQFARLRRGLRARTFHGRHRRATHSSRRCLRPFGQSPSERPGSQVTCGGAVLEGSSSLARLLAPFATALPRGPQVGTGRRHESRECPLSPRPRA